VAGEEDGKRINNRGKRRGAILAREPRMVDEARAHADASFWGPCKVWGGLVVLGVACAARALSLAAVVWSGVAVGTWDTSVRICAALVAVEVALRVAPSTEQLKVADACFPGVVYDLWDALTMLGGSLVMLAASAPALAAAAGVPAPRAAALDAWVVGLTAVTVSHVWLEVFGVFRWFWLSLACLLLVSPILRIPDGISYGGPTLLAVATLSQLVRRIPASVRPRFLSDLSGLQAMQAMQAKTPFHVPAAHTRSAWNLRVEFVCAVFALLTALSASGVILLAARLRLPDAHGTVRIDDIPVSVVIPAPNRIMLPGIGDIPEYGVAEWGGFFRSALLAVDGFMPPAKYAFAGHVQWDPALDAPPPALSLPGSVGFAYEVYEPLAFGLFISLLIGYAASVAYLVLHLLGSTPSVVMGLAYAVAVSIPNVVFALLALRNRSATFHAMLHRLPSLVFILLYSPSDSALLWALQVLLLAIMTVWTASRILFGGLRTERRILHWGHSLGLEVAELAHQLFPA
jgi:hypothetical protein